MELVIHLDLDSFFASVEKVATLEYSNLPVAISAPRGQAMVVAATYDAKAKGVKIGVTKNQAEKLCPNLVFVTSRMQAYTLVSKRVRDIIEKYCDEYETLGMDECFISSKSLKREYYPNSGDREENYKAISTIIENIKSEVKKKLGIEISAGVGSNKTIAKLSTSLGKPNGLVITRYEDELKLIGEQELGEITGIGPATEEKLKRAGFEKVKDLQGMNLKNIQGIVGKFPGKMVYSFLYNQPIDFVEGNPSAKSMGASRSLRYNEKYPDRIFEELLGELLQRLQKNDRSVRVISVYAMLENEIRGNKIDLKSPTKEYKKITFYSRKLYENLGVYGKVKQIGITFHRLGRFNQLELDENGYPKSIVVEEEPFIEEGELKRDLQKSFYRGMEVEHPQYGKGIVLWNERGGLRVKFGNVERLFDLAIVRNIKIIR